MSIHNSENANTANHLPHNVPQLFRRIIQIKQITHKFIRKMFIIFSHFLAQSFTLSISLYLVHSPTLSIHHWWPNAIWNNFANLGVQIHMLPKSHWIVKELTKREKIWMHNCVDTIWSRTKLHVSIYFFLLFILLLLLLLFISFLNSGFRSSQLNRNDWDQRIYKNENYPHSENLW